MVNDSLDVLVSAGLTLSHRAWPAFQVCGCTGLALAFVLAMTLVIYLDLSPIVITAILLSAVLTFFGLVMATKIITGEEQIIYYHHEIAVMINAALLLWLLGEPLLPYLDLTILGIGMFLACGRVGCLMVGCCHGRPHSWGVRYRQEHAAAGFTPYLVGVRLFPIQAIESLWVLCIVIVGVIFILNGYPSGTALAWYVVMYDLGRFCFEFVRGDVERPYLWGYSQGQWLSLLLTCFVVLAEISGKLPFHAWHFVVAAGLVFAMIAVALKRHFQSTARYELLHPRHVKEVAEVVEALSSVATEIAPLDRWSVLPRRDTIAREIQIGRTSFGVQVSAGTIGGATHCTSHYTLSHRDGGMTEETGRLIARLILQLRQARGSSDFLTGSRGVFHLLIYPPGGKEVAS